MSTGHAEIKADKWTRFDMWAHRSHQAAQAAQAAIATEHARQGDTVSDMTSPLTDAYNRAADVYRDLASASASLPESETARAFG